MTLPSRPRIARAVGLALLTLPFLIPLLRPGWVQSHEGLSYPIRQVELLRCWQDGMWSARWFPDLNYGQGYPFLCFYAPLVFFSAGIGQLAGASPDAALKIPLVLSILAGAAGAYRLARLGTGPAGAFVAAALFTYAPYRVRDVFIRGDVAEFLAMGFLPWALWAVLRLRSKPEAGRATAVALTGAAAILSHNILGMLTGISMAGAALVALALAPAGQRLRTGLVAAAGGLGALLLTAFFWLPALHERQFVRIDVLTSGHYDLARWFVSPLEFFGRGEFPGLSQELPMSFELGWATLVSLAAGIFVLARRNRRPSGADGEADARPTPDTLAVVILGALLFGGGVLMTTAAGAPVYRLFPLLEFVQFPWRFLALAALGGALLGGLAVGALADRGPARRAAAGDEVADPMRARRAAAAGDVADPMRARRAAAVALGAAAVAVVLALPLLGPKSNTALLPWAIDPAEMWKKNGTTTKGEYLPLAVEEARRPRGFTDDLYRIEGDGRLTGVERRAGRWTFRTEAAERVMITLRDVAYPGWTATANGSPVPLGHVERAGNLRLELPAGTHDVEVILEPTPRRRASRGVSAGAAFGLLGFVAFRIASRRRRTA